MSRKFLSTFALTIVLLCANQAKAANSFYSFLIDTAIDTASAVIDANRNQSSYVPSKAKKQI